jgi:hypothetical protein
MREPVLDPVVVLVPVLGVAHVVMDVVAERSVGQPCWSTRRATAQWTAADKRSLCQIVTVASISSLEGFAFCHLHRDRRRRKPLVSRARIVPSHRAGQT